MTLDRLSYLCPHLPACSYDPSTCTLGIIWIQTAVGRVVNRTFSAEAMVWAKPQRQMLPIAQPKTTRTEVTWYLGHPFRRLELVSSGHQRQLSRDGTKALARLRQLRPRQWIKSLSMSFIHCWTPPNVPQTQKDILLSTNSSFKDGSGHMSISLLTHSHPRNSHSTWAHKPEFPRHKRKNCTGCNLTMWSSHSFQWLKWIPLVIKLMGYHCGFNFLPHQW